MKMSGEKAIHRQELERGLLTQKISRLFLKYTIPGVAGLLFLGIQSVIDGVILGRFVGANALASVNLILPCYSLMTALSIVIGVGCQTLIGINLGRSDRQEANNAITTSFLFLGGISVLISGLIYIFAGDIARMLGANDVLVTGAVDYIRSLVPFFPLLSLMFLGDYMIKAMGHPLYAMIVMGSTVLINIGLDLLFIPVMGLGIKGAGLATGLAFTLYLLSLLFSHHSQKFHGIRHIYHTAHDNLHLIPILCILLHQNLCHMQSAPYTSVPPSPKPILFSFFSYLFPPCFEFFSNLFYAQSNIPL